MLRQRQIFNQFKIYHLQKSESHEYNSIIRKQYSFYISADKSTLPVSSGSKQGRPVKHGSWCHLPVSTNQRPEIEQVVTEWGVYSIHYIPRGGVEYSLYTQGSGVEGVVAQFSCKRATSNCATEVRYQCCWGGKVRKIREASFFEND